MAERRKRGGYFGNGGSSSGGRFGMSLTGPGTMFTIAFIALAIGMGILLSRGVTPKTVLSDPGETGDLELVLETPSANGSRLQLKTLKFRECASKAAVGLIVDRSGSMRGEKMTNLKDALSTFTTGLGNQSVIGMISFSSNDNSIETSEDVPFSRYQDVKGQVASAIKALYAAGSTHTRAAFALMKDRIIAAQKKFPENNFAMILLSDGVPEDRSETGTNCPSGLLHGGRCFALSQDPTQEPSIAREIRDAGINVYAIAIYDKNDPDDVYFLPAMRNMMQNIVSSPTNFYETPDPTKLKQIYKEIAQKICSDL
jgi:hypothetical protein